MRDREVHDVRDGADGRRHAGNRHHRVADGVVVVDADVRVVEEVLAVRVADEVVLGHLVLPVGARDGDDLRAALLALLRRVDRGGVDADVVEEEHHVPFLDAVVLDDGRAEVHGALQLQVLERLVEDGERGLHERVDVGETAGAEEHLAHREGGVPAACVDVYELVVGDGVRHQLRGGLDVGLLLLGDFADVRDRLVDVSVVVQHVCSFLLWG